jgi:kinesin family member 2/24
MIGDLGSGKTFTMQGIQALLADELFEQIESSEDCRITVQVSYFEIYGGRCQDLLNNREKLNVREDGSGEVVVSELLEVTAQNVDDLHSIIQTGNANRTTHATESNDVSSRSHAVCLILLRHIDSGKLVGKISLIDLAGSERGADTKSHNRQRRMEGSEINKSLLALKECIRAIDSGSSHVPYRASKLTLVLKDSFTRNSTRTVMIANISPAASSADHTLNTLRYADRVKERVVGGQAAKNAQAAASAGLSPAEAKAIKNAKKEEDFDEKIVEDDFDDFDEEMPQDQALVDELHRTVQDLFEEEEELLNLHMNIIQENAELLTEEGRLLQQIQGEDYDIDSYASRLDIILKRKEELINILKEKLVAFRRQLAKEEMTSMRLAGKMPSY